MYFFFLLLDEVLCNASNRASQSVKKSLKSEKKNENLDSGSIRRDGHSPRAHQAGIPHTNYRNTCYDTASWAFEHNNKKILLHLGKKEKEHSITFNQFYKQF